MSMRNGSFPTSTGDDSKMPWFHGQITREQTERLLRGRSDGTFLIRNSTNYPGDFTLCVSFKGKVEHYRIYLVKNQYTCDHEELFDNLIQLVSHYKRDADGLCHRLVTPQVSEAFRLQCEAANREERLTEFELAGVVISRNELQLGDVVGHGEFGDVLAGFYKSNRVAVKTLKNGLSIDLLNEARIMIGLKHPYLVNLLGVVIDQLGSEVLMVIEYMANGNLVDFLRSRGRHQVEKEQLLRFSTNVADAMAYMESVYVVHRDLAARNVLLDVNYNAKISDFGLAQKVDQKSVDRGRGKFPIKWTAPEALREGAFTNKSDVWSFGVLLWEIYSFGRVPYPRIPIQDVVRHIERGYRMEPPEACPASMNDLMTECWNLNPAERPTFAMIGARLRRHSDFN
ncbi:unnamed protein product [Bursaphelenchus okinawaensis]|uniref:Tyrosine-protein kinase n=1 Tax=Bursaphelenchus okinawaensis TaxID=465554 RepID=A0A811JVM8_9BILA|nr:unnamed protein product [Bursaphelenchus okinawaensis]CAG9085285.1 unnamed protein product [Bursaphelenchus okinawaensis]